MKINFKEFFTGAYWKKFVTWDFWFEVDTFKLHGTDFAILVVGTLFFLIGMGMSLYSKKQKDPFSKELYKKFGSLFFWIGLLEVVWFGFRYENIIYFGTNFTAALILLIGIIWAFMVFKNIGRKYNVNLENWHKEQLKQKYLNLPSR